MSEVLVARRGQGNSIRVLSTHKMNQNESHYYIELHPETNGLYIQMSNGRQFVISIARVQSFDFQTAIRGSNGTSNEMWIRYATNFSNHSGIETVCLDCENKFSWVGVDIVKEVCIQSELV